MSEGCRHQVQWIGRKQPAVSFVGLKHLHKFTLLLGYSKTFVYDNNVSLQVNKKEAFLAANLTPFKNQNQKKSLKNHL